ncbi:MAG: T9SS type A sorting domain-containing protein [Chitinophagaceae bacterium]
MIRKIQNLLTVTVLTILSLGFPTKSYATACNWKSNNPTVLTWDSCKSGYAVLNGYVYFNSNIQSCFKYTWKINGIVISNSRVLYKTITQNGSYSICLKVTDTCNNCDTTFCSTKTISCFGNSCNWKNRTPYMFTWDSCKNNSSANVNGYISFQHNTSCFKYSWTVNGTAAGTGYVMHKSITQNGTYNICVKVTDTCNKCDTTFCSTKTISCFGSKCNWKNKISAINFFDSCNGIRYRNSSTGYIAMNQNSNNSCLKFVWKVDSQIVSNTYYFTTPIIRNGYHNYCVKITDTCNNCDTVICQWRFFQCNNLKITSEFLNETIFVYPLPAKQHISIYSNFENSKAVIYSINGMIIWEGIVKEGENIITTEKWPSGMYILTVFSKDGNIHKQIIKE